MRLNRVVLGWLGVMALVCGLGFIVEVARNSVLGLVYVPPLIINTFLSYLLYKKEREQ